MKLPVTGRMIFGLAALAIGGGAARANWPGTGAFGSLNELSPSAVSYIQTRGGTVGVSIFNNKTGKTYTWNGGWQVRTASIIKVGIMAAVMDRAQRAGRGLTDWEKGQLWPMITQSDNNAATALWNSVGPYNVVNYMRSLGMSSTVIAPENANWWGYVRTTPNDFVRLVAKIQYYQLWSADKHAYALYLMKNVTSWQAFLRGGLPAGTDAAEKCGWYPEYDTGYYRVHAVGAVNAGGNSYTISIMTRYPVGYNLGYCTTTIAGVASRIHASFLGSSTTTTTSGGGAVKINSGPLNVRSGPGTGYSILGTVSAGQVYIASASSGGWWKIYYDNRTGWVSGAYASKVTGVTAVVVNTDILNVRTGPGTGYAVAGTVTRGMEFFWTQYEGLNGFYKIYWRGGFYYVSGSFVVRKSY